LRAVEEVSGRDEVEMGEWRRGGGGRRVGRRGGGRRR
jgi:hypothetical protein